MVVVKTKTRSDVYQIEHVAIMNKIVIQYFERITNQHQIFEVRRGGLSNNDVSKRSSSRSTTKKVKEGRSYNFTFLFFFKDIESLHISCRDLDPGEKVEMLRVRNRMVV